MDAITDATTNAVARLLPHVAPGPPIVIDREDWPILSLVDGRRTVADIIVALDSRPFDVCNTLAGLVDAGLVAVDYDAGP